MLMLVCAAIQKTVSVVLLLGNMQFKQEKNSDQAVMPDDTGTATSLTAADFTAPVFLRSTFTIRDIVCK